MRRIAALIPLVCLLLLAGCVPNRAYRTETGSCLVRNPGDCATASIERHPIDAQGTEYLLGFVEFDDQGAKHDRRQMDTLFAQLATESAAQDLCLVVFVHGWKHNAATDDDNVVAFRKLLAVLAATESEHGHGLNDKPRKIVGIYASWRGQSIGIADLISDLTFWTRKDAAQRVAEGSIRELLGRARTLRDTLDRTTWTGKRLPANTPAPAGETLRSTRLLTIGHSFGGLIVYTALAQYFVDRAAASATATALATTLGGATDADKLIAPYGDLVVIVNPAVEAIAWEPIAQLVRQRPAQGYARDQKPVFVEVTSTADDATGIAFPIGRALNTAFESFTSAEERRQARITIGHDPAYWTHDLTKRPDAPPPAMAAIMASKPDAHALVQAECQAHAAFEREWRRDGYLQPGWTRTYSSGAVLTHRKGGDFDPNDPYWIVKTDASLIADHSDITEPAFIDFVRQLYDELLLDGSACPSDG